MTTNRRQFLKNTSKYTAGYCLAGIGISSLLESCSSVKYITTPMEKGLLTISKSEFGGAAFIVVREKMTGRPFLLSRTDDGFKAFLLECTHKRCELKPTNTIMVCPCHQSEFDMNGKVLKAPAERDLDEFETQQDEKNIYIITG